jgi:hypothetical protein
VPIELGRSWTIGDSETGGSNMREELTTLAYSPSGEADLEVKFYAGRKMFSQLRRKVKKADWRIDELDKGGESTTVLRYPYQKGEAWTSKRGSKLVSFRIESASETVKVRAGTFSGCLKVREQIEGLPSWTYTYYAPGVGRVLTSVAGPGFETRNAELLAMSQTSSREAGAKSK